MEARKSVNKLAETIHSLLGWKSHLTSNWVKSVCDIMKTVPPEVSSIEFNPTNVKTKDSAVKADDELCNAISKIEDELGALTAYINELNTQRKQVLNEFLDLRGNIRVFCRIRPIAIGENFGRLRPVAAVDSSNVLLKVAENKSKTYTFDKVFHPGSSQDEVFAEIEPVIKSALDGYNACIFAYGQTGTGKSFTMEGTPHFPGVVPRAMKAIFKQAVDSNRVFLFSFSMLEIYLGNLKDLLVPQPTKAMDPMPPSLLIQTDPKGGVEIDNLVAIQVTDFNQALRLYRLGCRFRSTASTNSNITSSRSHCLIRLSITCFDAPERRREKNKIWFIDLGGSERVLKTKASGRRLDEGKAINLSLSALGDVINALQKKKVHVPYRNSKLTQVLKDSLGEDSKTLMLVHVSPKEEDLCETVCSLNFATRVRSIHLGNTDSTEERKQREIAITNKQREMKRIEDERQDVRRNIKKLNEELERLTGTAPPSNEQLDASHLSNKFTQHNLERMRSKTTDVTTAPLSQIPRFMKPTACSRGKSGVDYQNYNEKVQVPARRRRLSYRAESLNFPIKHTSEKNSECSISRDSCLVDLNVKSNTDDETECSQGATECNIKNILFSEQETSSKSSVQQNDGLVNKDRHGKVKKNSSSSTNLLKVDNWLQLHKKEPTITNVSQNSKWVLAIPSPEKKQTNKEEKEDDLPNGNYHKYKFRKKKNADDEQLENYANVAGFGRSKQDIDIRKLPIDRDGFINRDSSCNSICSLDEFDRGRILYARDLIDEVLMEEYKCGSSSNLNQDGNQVNKTFVIREEKGRRQCSDSISQEKNSWYKFLPSDSMSLNNEQCELLFPSELARSMFNTREDSGSSISISEQELQCLQKPTEICMDDNENEDMDTADQSLAIRLRPGIHNMRTEICMDNNENEDMDTADQSLAIRLRPGIHNMRTQRALFLGNENLKEPIMTLVKSQQNTENSGICYLLIGKVQIFWAGALLALGFQTLGLEDEFFQSLVL